MVKKFIAKRISYPLQDYFNGTNILSTYKFLLQSQYWSREQMEAYQFNKFVKLVNYAYHNVPFYHNLYKEAGFSPGDLKSIQDIKNLPIITKYQAREFNEQMISTSYDLKHTIKGITGGTTGPPLKLLRDRQDQTFVWAAFYRWYNWIGIDLGDKATKIWGATSVLEYPFKKKIKDAIKNFYYNRQTLNSFNINDSSIPELLHKLESFRPKIVRGYLSALIQIAEYIQKNDYSIKYSPKAISSTTETLFPPYKTLIEKAFKTKLYDQYGCGECNSISFDAGNPEGMFIAAEHAFIEILDENNREAGLKDGKIVLTNLDNYAMPFIRYENGDQACFGKNDQNNSICLPVLKRVLGRTADTIILKNQSKVHGVFFTDILDELFQDNPDYIHRFQVYQEIPGEIEFRIESKLELENEYTQKLKDALKNFFNSVKIVTMEELPLDKSGKYRYVVSSIK